jgi:hypothetical protein
MMHSKKMRYKEAFAWVKERRTKINPNPGFVKQLQEYERKLFGD